MRSFRILVGLAFLLAVVFLSPVGSMFATPIDWTSYTVPVTAADIIDSAFGWAGLWSILILSGMSMRYAPRIVRAIKRMA